MRELSTNFSIDSILAFRQENHQFGAARKGVNVVEVARELGGLHSQVDSACWQIAATRVAGRVRKEALWSERKLVRGWLARGTLHTIPEQDLDRWVSLLSAQDSTVFEKRTWCLRHGCTPEQLAIITNAVGEVLDGVPRTRSELVDDICQQINIPELGDALRSGWGTLLKPAAARGSLIFGPPRGGRTTFVSPEKWLNRELEYIDVKDARADLVTKFLSLNAVATIGDIAAWLGDKTPRVREWLPVAIPTITEVSVGGVPGYFSLPPVIDRIRKAEEPAITPLDVAVLPMFDPYVLAPLSQRPWLFADERMKPLVYRTAGWITGTILLRGKIAGTWRTDKTTKESHRIAVQLFRKSTTKQIKEAIDHEFQVLFCSLNERIESVSFQ